LQYRRLPHFASVEAAVMANPRKFSEKIALHNQKQAEETAAFERIMQEVSVTRFMVRKCHFFGCHMQCIFLVVTLFMTMLVCVHTSMGRVTTVLIFDLFCTSLTCLHFIWHLIEEVNLKLFVYNVVYNKYDPALLRKFYVIFINLDHIKLNSNFSGY